MVRKITWSPESLRTFTDIIEYLQQNWTQKEVTAFTERVGEKLTLLQTHPYLGSVKNKRLNIYRTILHKKVILIYKYRPNKKELVLLTFWNVLQDPAKDIY